MAEQCERNIHWDYYLALEDDVKRLSRYIEFDESNFNVFSIELARILLAASSEVEVVLKELCKLLDPGSKAENINSCRKIVKRNLPALIGEGIVCPLYGLSLLPWNSWGSDVNPEWWRSYNKVKHERHENYERANLGNVLNSVSGLFSLNVYYNHALFLSMHDEFPYRIIDSFRKLNPKAELFRLDDPFMYLHER